MKKDYRVIIPPIAKESLREIVEYIKIESPSAAIKVQKKLIEIEISSPRMNKKNNSKLIVINFEILYYFSLKTNKLKIRLVRKQRNLLN